MVHREESAFIQEKSFSLCAICGLTVKFYKNIKEKQNADAIQNMSDVYLIVLIFYKMKRLNIFLGVVGLLPSPVDESSELSS